MRVVALACLIATPALAQTTEDMSRAYAYIMTTAPHCGVEVDMRKAGELYTASGLDADVVGVHTWEAAQMVYQLKGAALDDWCAAVEVSVEELGLAP